jgi:hypothetical protein
LKFGNKRECSKKGTEISKGKKGEREKEIMSYKLKKLKDGN